MTFIPNPISAVSEEYITEIEKARDRLITLKEAYPANISTQELEKEVSRILTDDMLCLTKKEQTTLRPKLEDRTGQIVMEHMLPSWMPEMPEDEDTKVAYCLRIEGRNLAEMSRENGDPHRGYRKRQEPIGVFKVDELTKYWREILFLDKKVDSEEERDIMPEGADYLLSTVHRFYPVERCGKYSRGRNKGKKEQNGTLLGNYRVADNNLQVDLRIKSGPEKLWKMVALLTSLEKKPGITRESILDEAGARLVTGAADFEKRFVRLYHDIRNMYRGVGPDGTMALQSLYTDIDPKSLFLEKIPKRFKGFYGKFLGVEDRSSICLSNGKDLPPYYLELLIPMGRGDTFGKNVVDALFYPAELFRAMYEEHGYDPFAYKVRNENRRSERYTPLEWMVAYRLAPALMTGTSLDYVNTAINLRMKNAGYR